VSATAPQLTAVCHSFTATAAEPPPYHLQSARMPSTSQRAHIASASPRNAATHLQLLPTSLTGTQPSPLDLVTEQWRQGPIGRRRTKNPHGCRICNVLFTAGGESRLPQPRFHSHMQLSLHGRSARGRVVMRSTAAMGFYLAALACAEEQSGRWSGYCSVALGVVGLLQRSSGGKSR